MANAPIDRIFLEHWHGQCVRAPAQHRDGDAAVSAVWPRASGCDDTVAWCLRADADADRARELGRAGLPNALGGRRASSARRNEVAVKDETACRTALRRSAIAFSSIASNTGSRSPGELEMTFSTSEVAVCCSSDSVRSRCAAQLVEQPGVLDGDHGLGGEVLD